MDLTNLNKDRKQRRKGNPLELSTMMYGKVPPQAKSVEDMLLGVMIMEPNRIPEIMQYLKKESFYVEANQRIYQAIVTMATQNRFVDLVTVVEELKKNEELDIVGGPYYVTNLTKEVRSSAGIIGYCAIILEKHIARELIRISGEIIGDAYEDGTDVFDLLSQATASLYTIRHEIENIKSSPLDALAVKYKKRRDQTHADPAKMIYTGFKQWDDINGPLFRGGVFFLAGRPGMGKTAKVIEMIKRMAVKYHIGFCNLEMTDDQIIQRIISNIMEIDNDIFKLPLEQVPDWFNDKENEGLEQFINLMLHIESKPGMTIEMIIAKFKYWKFKYDIQVGIIDFLQIVGVSEERERYHDDLANLNYILRLINECAKDLDIPIIVLSQLNRENLKRGGNKEPELGDMKGSGKIEEIAYQISFLHRPEYYEITEDENGESTKGLLYHIIKKHRDGKLGKLKYKFEGQFSRLSEWNENKYEAPKFFFPKVGDKMVTNEEFDDDAPF